MTTLCTWELCKMINGQKCLFQLSKLSVHIFQKLQNERYFRPLKCPRSNGKKITTMVNMYIISFCIHTFTSFNDNIIIIMKDISLKYSGRSGERLRQWFMLSLASLSTFSTLWIWARLFDIIHSIKIIMIILRWLSYATATPAPSSSYLPSSAPTTISSSSSASSSSWPIKKHHHHYQVFANIFKWVYRWVHGCIARRKAASKYEYDDDDDDND